MAHTAAVATDKGLRTQPIENIIAKALNCGCHENLMCQFIQVRHIAAAHLVAFDIYSGVTRSIMPPPLSATEPQHGTSQIARVRLAVFNQMWGPTLNS
jgi:hypothetical protein